MPNEPSPRRGRKPPSRRRSGSGARSKKPADRRRSKSGGGKSAPTGKRKPLAPPPPPGPPPAGTDPGFVPAPPLVPAPPPLAPEDGPTRFGAYALNGFQRRAAAAIHQRRSVVVAAPTGAGKTLVAEIAVADTLARGKRVVYTSPIKALSNQKYRDFKSAPGAEVGILTGDVSISPDAPLLIMTTEILRNEIFDAPHRLHDVEVVVFDEIHYLDDPERGTVWEETILFVPPSIRFVALSATIPNLDQFVGWLRSVHAHPVEQIESSARPVPLHHFGFHPAVGPFEARDVERARRRVGRRRGSRLDPDLARTLLDGLHHERQLPVLWFCFSRKECERRARRNSWRTFLDRTERARMESLFDASCTAFRQSLTGDLVELRNLAIRGIGYHHAGMLPIHKEIVERLFTSGLLRLLFTTETFAMGVNMPAKTVVFDSLRKFDGVGFDWLRTRDYLQMAGRAGRQGIDEEGLVVSVLDTEDLHEAPLERIVFGEVEPVRSRFNLAYATLLRLTEHLGDRIEEAWERSFNRWQFEYGSPESRERNRERHLEILRRKLQFLRETGYLDERGLTDRGRVASRLSAYEVQFTECLFRGVFEEATPRDLAAAFVSIVFEERRNEQADPQVPQSFLATKRGVAESVKQLKKAEARLRLPDEIKTPDFSLTGATLAWCDGDPMDALERHTMSSPGDLVRVFRTAIQCLRQMRQVLSPSYALRAKLDEALQILNRDEVDARLQLELG